MSVISAEKPRELSERAAAARKRRAVFDTPFGRAVLQVTIVAVLLRLWELGVRAGWVSDFLFGAPSGIFKVFVRMAGNGELAADTGITLFEAILGHRNAFGLLSEDIHPDTGQLWGNLPQTYSMAGIINSATRLSSSWEEAWARA